MKAKTKKQVEIMALSLQLPKINNKQKKWAEKLHQSYVTKHYSNFICLECNHTWKDNLPDWTVDVLDHTCPNCNSKLTPLKNDVSFSKFESFAILSVVNEIQLIRYFTVRKSMSKKELPEYYIQEVFQEWDDFEINKRTKNKSNLIIIGLSLSLSWYSDGFQSGSNFDIKDPYDYYGRNKYSLNLTDIYPVMEVIPKIRRNGFNGDFHFCHPRKLFKAIFNDPIAETLLKLNEIEFLSFYVLKSKEQIINNWSQIKICMKHHYHIADVNMWFDLIFLLNKFEKDINNRKYICPDDLKQSHDFYRNKKRIHDDKEEAKQEALQLQEQIKRKEMDAVSLSLKRKYFKDFSFSTSKFEFVTLIKKEEFKKEGQILKHCVYENEYYKKKSSLIMSARIHFNPIETIEICLVNFEVLQARGYDNEPTEHHHEIIKIVEKNMRKIKAIVQKQQKELSNKINKSNIKKHQAFFKNV